MRKKTFKRFKECPMDSNPTIDIETLRDEAKRQLQLLKSLLEETQQKGLVEAPAADPKNRATFDTESLPKVLEVLDGESHKLEHLDMVLAVVGTMKAGKSTTINAIVGAEVLPNRNRAMTTLPTLIRHTPSVLQPRLVFEKIKPLNDLLPVLSTAIQSASAPPENLKELQGDANMQELLQQIKRQEPFAARHEGEEEIFPFLKSLNDLVRLCVDLKVDFPFGEYATVDTMPVIEVEFSHLKHMQATQGRLTLLDTPGPNEAGQQHLRHMLKDQLKKASAVLAVLDYSQLKSDADAQVRENLMEVSGTAKGRMYALVNKFDQKDRNSDDEETVKKYVAQTLMKDAIPEENVFPVSASWGYLASRARNEIQRNGKLPNKRNGKLPNKSCWVDDFGSLALGMLWGPKAAADVDLMQQVSDGLWKKSGFALPLEQVIVEAHQNAALEALRSAASKLSKYAKDTGDFFKANVGALKKSVTDLKMNIDNLQQDIEKIARIEASTEKALEDALQNMQDKISAEAERVRKEIEDTLEEYFKEGKRIEISNLSKKKESKEKSPEKKQNQSKKESGLSYSHSMNSGSEVHEKDFDPKSPIISFDDKLKANEFVRRIEESIRNVMQAAEENLQSCIQDGIDDFSREFECYRTESLERIRESIQKNIDGFDIKIRLPSMHGIKLEVSFLDYMENAIEEKTKMVNFRRRTDDLWGKVCSWLGTEEWGYESYSIQVECYDVDLKKIQAISEKSIDTIFNSANYALKYGIYPQLQKQVEAFFCAFTEKIEHMRGDLMAGVQKHNLDQATKVAILEDSTQMAREASALEKDATVLNDLAESLRSEKGVSSKEGKPA
jgi:signal recognition particle receptor subunit beta